MLCSYASCQITVYLPAQYFCAVLLATLGNTGFWFWCQHRHSGTKPDKFTVPAETRNPHLVVTFAFVCQLNK